MATGVEIKGVDKLVKRLRDMAKRHKPKTETVVAYSADYAVLIHENMELFHPNGQAKFLETALRTTAKQVNATVAKELAKGATMEEALLAGDAIILDASNALVPVQTGNLRDSGYIDVR